MASSKTKASKKKNKDGQERQPSPEEVMANAEVKLQWVRFAQILAFFFGLSVLVLAAEPLAHAIAGTKTSFSLSATLSASIALGATTMLAGGGFALQSRRAHRHKKRTRELESQVEDLQNRLNKAISGNHIPAQGVATQ